MPQHPNTSHFNPEVGVLQRGSISAFDPTTGIMSVKLNTGSLPKDPRGTIVKVPAPHSMFYNSGLFIGTHPVVGTPVAVAQSDGGGWHFVSFVAENQTAVPSVTPGELLIQSTDNSFVTLDLNNNIYLGSDTYNIHLQTFTKSAPKTNLITLHFQDENHFTQASREVNGWIKRDLNPNTSWDPDTKLTDDTYDSKYLPIGMDPKATTNSSISGPAKNPPLVEHRELVYEFQYQSDVRDDLFETNRYAGTSSTTFYNRPNRRKNRSDTLSLSLVSPNYLLETVKGTVVDYFGNILDLNRTRLMGVIGDNPESLSKSTNAAQTYINIRALERKSVAYHFELNARKDLSAQTGSSTAQLLDYNADVTDSPGAWYNAKARRSRFFFDIDKEGQFKLNVPASSETGNIPLPVRYENYSTVSSNDSSNPDQVWFRKDGLDILLDSFAAIQWTPSGSGQSFGGHGSITLQGTNGDAGPLDRIASTQTDGVHIKHGTVYHDILQTCFMHQDLQRLDYQKKVQTQPYDISYIPPLTNIVSDTIRVSGTGSPDQGGPNAGGRSGSINLDGSLEMNIGANTIDRQSLWLDTAGGIVANIGHDKNFRSAVVGMDGGLFMQLGGFTVTGDTRFTSNVNKGHPAVLDLRIDNSGTGSVTMIRVDNLGVTIMCKESINLITAGNLRVHADSRIDIDADVVTLNGRVVNKEFGGTI